MGGKNPKHKRGFIGSFEKTYYPINCSSLYYK